MNEVLHLRKSDHYHLRRKLQFIILEVQSKNKDIKNLGSDTEHLAG